jgi:hypothetical protein
MQITSASGTERSLAVELVLEDIPGGGVVEKDDFKTASTEMKEGALLGVASDGIYHLTKTAMLAGALPASGFTAFQVYNNHELKVGDYLQNTGNTASGSNITAISASGTSLDVITLASGLSVAVAASGILIQAATGFTRALGYMYTPVAIATNPVDLTADNTGCGLLVRGRVRTALLPYFVDSTLKDLLPLVRFV